MKFFLFFVIAISSISVVMFDACKKNNSSSSGSSNYTPTCSGTPSFSITVKPLVNSSCGGCHNYSTYTQISSSASSIKSSIANGSMPKGSTLSDAQKNDIICWIDANSPNN